MATAGAIAVAGLAVSAAGSTAKAVSGGVQAKKAKKAIDEYDRQELTNKARGLSASTLGAEMLAEEQARATASGISAFSKSGTRGAAGNIGDLVEQEMNTTRTVASNLDKQQLEIDKMIAEDDIRIRGLMETREREDLAGLGQMYAAGQQNMWSGMSEMAQTGSAAAKTAYSGGFEDLFSGNKTSSNTNISNPNTNTSNQTFIDNEYNQWGNTLG